MDKAIKFINLSFYKRGEITGLREGGLVSVCRI